ncbi:MAG: hypothetical protein KDB27_32115, partial [Planctomycetales bacterium]|nr:hypothetical protein [Planctomycetales bacterium]
MKRALLKIVVAALTVFSSFHSALGVPVTDGMLLWLDATDADTLFTDAALTIPASPGDAIGGWADKSGNNFHATQVDVAFQPVWQANAIGDQSAVRFSAAEMDGMIIDDSLTV